MAITTEQLERLAKGLGGNIVDTPQFATSPAFEKDGIEYPADWILTPGGQNWLLDEMVKRGYGVNIMDDGDQWTCYLAPNRDFDYSSCGQADTLPHAVALAAMAVVESEGR